MYVVPVASVQIGLVQNASKRHLHPPTGRGLDISQRRRTHDASTRVHCFSFMLPSFCSSPILQLVERSLVLRYNAHI
jgi:hypothetical protein